MKPNHSHPNVLNRLKELGPSPGSTVEESIECLVRQAEMYTTYLLGKQGVSITKKVQPQKDNTDPSQLAVAEGKDQDKEKVEELEIKVHEEEDLESAFGDEPSFTRLTKQPSLLVGGTLKYYQLVGLNWLISLYESGINGILADDMGLGKTIQTISIIAFIKESRKIKRPHLIVAPKITLTNWANEFEKWLPCCNVAKLIATKDERDQILTSIVDKGNFDVLLTSFEGVRICLPKLKKIRWHYLVVDEAHKLKNEESLISQVVRKLNTECKLLLTGTPLQNNLRQIWSLLNFLLPDIFKDADIFDNWFVTSSSLTETESEARSLKMIGQLHKILKPFMLRRTKLEVQRSLPSKKEIHIYVGLTELQLKVYRSLLQNRTASQDEKKFYLNLLMQLRKVCNHPYLFPNTEEEGAPEIGEHLVTASGKMIVLDRLLKKLHHEGGHQVLIFSQMTMVLNILEDYCNLREWPFCRIDGSTEMNKRDSQIEEFMRPGCSKFVFLLSTRAGGLGINLTSADTVVIFDSDWNPQMDLQAMDRAHRIGQRNHVNVYRLITESTVEEKIIERQTIKLNLDHLVIQQSRNAQKNNRALTKDELRDMVQFGASCIFKTTSSTISDKDIDEILARGQTKTQALNKEVEQHIGAKADSLVNFSMNSINIFDFMQQDQLKKNMDAEALEIACLRELQGDLRTRRQKNLKQDAAKKEIVRPERKINLPEYHFYHDKVRLVELLNKEEDNNYPFMDGACEPLTPEQQVEKEELLASGFRDWSKSQFNSFVNGCEKFGRKNIASISELVGRSVEEVTRFSEIFWSRIDELSEKERILKQITNGEEKIESRQQHMYLLQWKASRSFEIDFNPQIYTKFKSKLYTIDADRFLAQSAYKEGIRNMNLVRDRICDEPMFRFDHFLRSRTEGDLNKRLLSIYKLLQKEKDYEEFGMDINVKKETKRRQKKTKRVNKESLQVGGRRANNPQQPNFLPEPAENEAEGESAYNG